MAKLPSAFNSNEHEKMDDYTAIDAGNYPAMIHRSEMKDTKAKKEGRARIGSYLELRFRILSGKFKNRVVFARLNLVNENPVAVELANKELATICEAAGKVVIEDSQELHGIPMTISVTKTPATANSPERNEIKGYHRIKVGENYEMPLDENTTTEGTTEGTTEDTTAEAGGEGKKKRPWD